MDYVRSIAATTERSRASRRNPRHKPRHPRYRHLSRAVSTTCLTGLESAERSPCPAQRTLIVAGVAASRPCPAAHTALEVAFAESQRQSAPSGAAQTSLRIEDCARTPDLLPHAGVCIAHQGERAVVPGVEIVDLVGVRVEPAVPVPVRWRPQLVVSPNAAIDLRVGMGSYVWSLAAAGS